MTTEEAVAQGAKLFADAEEALAALSAGMPSIITAVRDEGHIGALECMSRISEAGVISNAALGEIATLHQNFTTRCQDLGIDLPQARSGGGR